MRTYYFYAETLDDVRHWLRCLTDSKAAWKRKERHAARAQATPPQSMIFSSPPVPPIAGAGAAPAAASAPAVAVTSAPAAAATVPAQSLPMVSVPRPSVSASVLPVGTVPPL